MIVYIENVSKKDIHDLRNKAFETHGWLKESVNNKL